jgi:superoxide dismutase, Cu-Zn family
MKTFAVLAAAAIAVAGCSSMNIGGGGAKAVASLQPTHGNAAHGTVTFTQRGETVHVVAHVMGLKPGATHGFHVHEKGDCGSADGMSTGGHFNPDAHPHGPQSAAHHAGDMPALVADAYGTADATFDLAGVSVGGSAPDLTGKGLIVHRDPDDYTTQPTGNAGPRIACAVIHRA